MHTETHMAAKRAELRRVEAAVDAAGRLAPERDRRVRADVTDELSSERPWGAKCAGAGRSGSPPIHRALTMY